MPVPTNMSRLLPLSPRLSSVFRRGNNSGSILSGRRRRPLTLALSTRAKALRPKREMNELHVATALAQVQPPWHRIPQLNAAIKPRRFVETVEAAVKLNIDPRKPGQAVRGTVELPHGTGKKVRVAVFARGNDALAAMEAGAVRVGAEEMADEISSDGGSSIDFDVAIATPEMMPIVGHIGRVLGPRGLMPNPRLGTVTARVSDAIKAAMRGKVTFRANREGLVMAGLGNTNFSHKDIMANLRAFLLAIGTLKPEAQKGKYFLQVDLSSTMGKGVPVEISTADPNSQRFFELAPEDKDDVKKRMKEIEEIQSKRDQEPRKESNTSTVDG